MECSLSSSWVTRGTRPCVSALHTPPLLPLPPLPPLLPLRLEKDSLLWMRWSNLGVDLKGGSAEYMYMRKSWLEKYSYTILNQSIDLQSTHQILINVYKSTDAMFRLKYDTNGAEIHI